MDASIQFAAKFFFSINLARTTINISSDAVSAPLPLCTAPHSRGYRFASAVLRSFLRSRSPPPRSAPARRNFLVAVARAASSAGVVFAPGGNEQAGGLVAEHLRPGPSDQLIVVPLPSPEIGWRVRDDVTALLIVQRTRRTIPWYQALRCLDISHYIHVS